ncbi:hypothetical protein M3P05_03465 [Sansalvadorimonas sp. 2012CJ34-2]|uniref:Uncharacterized protein n=1 Tax=Parendozoicomonas callyspongiae TaxID=2942213 RepID=A0ABT0PC94_9GAMM|nr:hypothetical protein [Sansalvadorimonas sp. 2012CJ34-2]MCL6269000.1 hypothetical protein [Sansalvadorimonas sp. 2012CJ34-2]
MRLRVSQFLLQVLAGLCFSALSYALPVLDNGIIKPVPPKKNALLTIEWIKVPNFGESPFIIVKFSGPISKEIHCGNPRFGSFKNTPSALNMLQTVNENGTPVDVELAPQPCIPIEEYNYFSIQYLKIYGKKYLPEGSGTNVKPIKKGSKKKLRINPSW